MEGTPIFCSAGQFSVIILRLGAAIRLAVKYKRCIEAICSSLEGGVVGIILGERVRLIISTRVSIFKYCFKQAYS